MPSFFPEIKNDVVKINKYKYLDKPTSFGKFKNLPLFPLAAR